MCLMFFFWYGPVFVIGISHLSVSDTLGSAESSEPCFINSDSITVR